MTKKQFERLGRHVATESGEFVPAGSIVYQRPLKHFLRGLCFEGSGFNKDRFFVWVFAMPLYVPIDHIAFTMGDRLRCGHSEGWDNQSNSILIELRGAFDQQAKPWLAEHSDLKRCVSVLSRNAAGNPNHAIAAAFGKLLLGQTSDSLRSIAELLRRIDLTVEWQRTIAERATYIEKLAREDELKAREQLRTWELETLQSLNLLSGLAL